MSAKYCNAPGGRLLLAALLALAISACATPAPIEDTSGLNRETPEATFEYFKTMAQHNQWANEWMVFSPNFKRMLSQAAGRNVDVGDYSTARSALPEAKNSSKDMQDLLSSTLEGVQYVGADRARMTITAGGRRIRPTLVRMTRWEMKIRDQDTPATGLVSHPGDAIQVNADGSITVRVQAEQGVAAALRTVPRDQIEGFAIKSEWYVDDFGGLVGAGVGQAPPTNPNPTPTPQPGTYPPPGAYQPAPGYQPPPNYQPPGPTPPPTQPAVVGSGSPDG